jgi:hypothetical protein
MRLNDPLVTSFVYEGKEYKIDLAFDNVLDVFDVLSDDSLRDYEKIEICLELLLGEQDYVPTVELWNHIYKNFIEIKRKQPIQYDLKGNPLPVQEDDDDERLIDLERDAEYIYASFLQAYGINLFEQQRKLHWHEFKALLHGLPSDTSMQRIIQIRLWKPSKGESSEYRESMRKLQKIYALEEKE